MLTFYFLAVVDSAVAAVLLLPRKGAYVPISQWTTPSTHKAVGMGWNNRHVHNGLEGTYNMVNLPLA
jgi:hypothetical protein